MLILHDDCMTDHDPGPDHPECPDRLVAVAQTLRKLEGLQWIVPQVAERRHIARVHTAHHIDAIVALRGKSGMLDGDTIVSPGSAHAAYVAAGAAVRAVDEVMTGHTTRAFAAVRPPGHHAESHMPMGFCFFNNVAIAAEHALAEHGCNRVLIVDWDVHHGNGTQASFYDRADVLFFSLHQYPFYPGTGGLSEMGSADGAGYTVNVPFPGGQGDGDYATAFVDLLWPIADRFNPDLVLVSAGFDAHRADPLGGMVASEEGYAIMTGAVRDIADKYADGRLILFLEGGYDLASLAASVRTCVQVIGGASLPPVPHPGDRGGKVLREVMAQHRTQWRL